jgi:hypothetical protein
MLPFCGGRDQVHRRGAPPAARCPGPAPRHPKDPRGGGDNCMAIAWMGQFIKPLLRRIRPESVKKECRVRPVGTPSGYARPTYRAPCVAARMSGAAKATPDNPRQTTPPSAVRS